MSYFVVRGVNIMLATLAAALANKIKTSASLTQYIDP